MSDSYPKSPRITDDSWGHIQVEGFEKTFKDVKLWPGGARGWDWNETGTRHSPGIQPADVQELIDHGSDMVVLSRGRYKRLSVQSETLELLKDHDIRTYVLETGEAIEKYNELSAAEPVGALIHSTC